MISKNISVMFLCVILIVACSPSIQAEESSQPGIEEDNNSATEEGIVSKATETIQPQNTPLPLFSEEAISPGITQAYSFSSSSGQEMDYLLYFPIEYYEQPTWPIMIYLHGDRGITHTADDVLTMTPLSSFDPDSEFPFILLSPVSPSGNWKFYYESIDELLKTMIKSLPTDPNSIILTGASAGAYGAWHYALKNPDQFAAFAPVAGGPGGNPVPENICLLKDLPIWIFHSEVDFAMRIDSSYAALEALEKCGNNAILMTSYSDLDHVSSIVSTYANPVLYEWMLQQ